ncbi:MAG: hypothetical protein U9Q03_00875 [Patescibacteria group bacterium]|nr:hypothetical protein [Patescibacteria group bacterium]
MDRRRILILTVALAVLLPGGCGEWQKLPIPLRVDETFGGVERPAVFDAITEWNERAGGRYAYGDAVFEVVGYSDDTFNEHDYEDGEHTVYRISRCNPDEQYLQEVHREDGERIGIIGYCTLADTIDILYDFDVFMAAYEDQLYLRAEEQGIEDADFTGHLERLRYNYVRSLTLHELGHMLGLTHYNHRVGVMNSDGLGYFYPQDHLTDADLDAFCLVYDCRCNEPFRDVFP